MTTQSNAATVGLKTVIINRTRDGKPAPLKITAADTSPENMQKILAHVAAIEGADAGAVKVGRPKSMPVPQVKRVSRPGDARMLLETRLAAEGATARRAERARLDAAIAALRAAGWKSAEIDRAISGGLFPDMVAEAERLVAALPSGARK